MTISVLAVAIGACTSGGDVTLLDGNSSTTTVPTGGGDGDGGGTGDGDGGDATDPEAAVERQLTVDWASVGPPTVEVTGADAVVGGAPDPTRARAVLAALAATGVDMTGTSVHVVPVTGTDDWLLLLGLTDDSALSESEDASGDDFILAIVDQMAEHGLTRLALNYTGEDDDGPLRITATASLAELQAVIAEEVNAEDTLRIQVVRP